MFSWWSSSEAVEETTEEASGSNNDKNTSGSETATLTTTTCTDSVENVAKPKDATETAKDLAKNVGSFLYSFASVASETAVKMKDTVKETVEGKVLLGDFNKEQEKFLHEKHNKCKETGVPPWVGYHEEESMKSQILALSSDERNFLRDPPPGVQFMYDYEIMFPVALATLEEDPELKKMRFNLVPKKIKEEPFWRNYFYRVSLIKQSSQLTTLAQSTNGDGGSSSENKANSNNKPNSLEVSKGVTHTKQKEISKKTTPPDNTNDDIGDIALSTSPSHEEFISDAFDGAQELSKEDLEQIGVARLTEKTEKMQASTTNVTNTATTSSVTTTATATSQSNAGKSAGSSAEKKSASAIPDWEKELQEELEEYDVVVNDDGDDDDDDGSWEKEIEDMLEAD